MQGSSICKQGLKKFAILLIIGDNVGGNRIKCKIPNLIVGIESSLKTLTYKK